MSLLNRDIAPEDAFKDPKDLEVNMKESLAAINKAVLNAQKCLASEAFQEYKKSYLEAKDKILDAMLKYHNGFFLQSNQDLSAYAMNMCRFMQRVLDLRSLLVKVEAQAKLTISVDEESTNEKRIRS